MVVWVSAPQYYGRGGLLSIHWGFSLGNTSNVRSLRSLSMGQALLDDLSLLHRLGPESAENLLLTEH